ncbi:hypothetical protein [Methylocystis sp.]|uniref:hypothetical protein n=1 Tax=Methylocystis sp. TaxID=1911079 RepID=UPI003DA3B6CF
MTDIAHINRTTSVHPLAQAIRLSDAVREAFRIADSAISFWEEQGCECHVYDASSYVRRRLAMESVPVKEIVAAAKVLRAAASEPFDAKQTATMIGLLIDAYVSARQAESRTLRAAVISLLQAGEGGTEGYGPTVISLSIKALLEEPTDFAPGPGNIIVAFKVAGSQVRSRLRALEQMLAKREAFFSREWPERYSVAWGRESQDQKELVYAPGIAMDIAPTATRTLAEELI